jgi:tartronate-semialdehyde synthase
LATTARRKGWGCKAIRVTDLGKIHYAETAMARMTEFQGSAIVESILEGAVNIGMGTEIDKITEFEDLVQNAADAPTVIALLD